MKENSLKNILIGLLIALILVIVTIGVLFVTGVVKINSKNETSKNNNTEEKQEEKKEESTIKIDKDKDYVYLADYIYEEQKYLEYSRGTTTENSKRIVDKVFNFSVNINDNKISDIKVPYININSKDAKVTNELLKNYYIEIAKEFDACAEQANSNLQSCSTSVDYRVYTNDKIVSIVIAEVSQATAPATATYYTYTFDIKTGKILTFDEVLSSINQTRESIIINLKESIEEAMTKYFGDMDSYNDYCIKQVGKNCYDQTYELVNELIKGNEQTYFVTSNDKLVVITRFYTVGQDYASNVHPLIIK